MDPLLSELTGLGLLDSTGIEWIEEHRHQRGGSADTAILELDLLDEDELSRGLQALYSLEPASESDIATADPALGLELPLNFSQSFSLCPLRRAGSEVVVGVTAPLSDESLQELSGIFGLQVTQLIATDHAIKRAYHAVYELPLDERTRALESRIARRRSAGNVRMIADRVSLSNSFSDAAGAILAFAGHLLEYACFLVHTPQGLSIATEISRLHGIALPRPGSTLYASICHGGYFVGPLRQSEDDQSFYASLARPLPRWAFVAPVPVEGHKIGFYGDNGQRAIPPRRIAELTVLVSRLGQHGHTAAAELDTVAPAVALSRAATTAVAEPAPAPRSEQTAAEMAAQLAAEIPELSAPEFAAELMGELPELATAEEVAPPADATVSDPPTTTETAAEPDNESSAEPQPATTNAAGEQLGAASPASQPAIDVSPPIAEEQAALAKLRPIARAAGVTIDALVDELLALREAPPGAARDGGASMVGEMRSLFESLATNIPAQLAKGMESAFREMVPRLATGASAAPAHPPAHQPPTPSAAASAELVVKEAKPREVPSYRSRRRKAKRVKL